MREIFIIIELLSKILDRIPTASEKIKMELIYLRKIYAKELIKEKDDRDDALIDNIRDRILELSKHAIDLISAKGINISSDYDSYRSEL